jgi:hypothetical protein
MSDEDKIRLQYLLDVKKFGKEVYTIINFWQYIVKLI